MKDEEIIDLIFLLLTRDVPDSLDKRLVLEWMDKTLFIPPAGKCQKCGKAMICPECDEISVDTDVDVTLRIGGHIVHL